jgi:peptidyl-prolyl cis-trans isomerase D
MLQKIRDNTQGVVSKVFMGLLIAVFALWGVDSIVGNFFVNTPKLTVNGDEILTAEIDNLAQRKTQQMLAQLGENPDLSTFDESLFRQAAVNELIQRKLLQQSSANSGMGVSAGIVDQKIKQSPDFQVDGVYNDERASLVLRGAGYTRNSYRALLGEEAMLQQVLAAYTATGFATPDQLTQLATLIHQKRTARYVVVQTAPFIDSATVSDEEIKTYYQAHQQDFAQEEQVRIEYLELNKDTMMAAASVTEEELQTAYQQEVAGFQAQTERRASHILWEAKSEEELAAARKEADAVKVRLEAGEDFSALATEFSDDTGSKQNGGDVGFTTGTSFVEPFEAALKALTVNQVSVPVQTEFGVHLIKLTELSDTNIDSFEQRRVALESDLKQKAVDQMFATRVDELKNLAFESVDLDGPAQSLKLSKQTTDFFTRTTGAGIAAQQAVRDAAFGTEVLDQALNSEVINVDANRSVVLRVQEHQPAQVRGLDVVTGEVELILRQQKAKAQAEGQGKSFVEGMQNGGNIDGLLATQNLSWIQVDAIERVAPTVDPELTDKIFLMEKPAVGSPRVAGYALRSGDYAVIELQSVADGSAADFKDGEEANMRNFVSQQMGANDIAGFIKSLEARAEIEGRDTQLVVQDPLL